MRTCAVRSDVSRARNATALRMTASRSRKNAGNGNCAPRMRTSSSLRIASADLLVRCRLANSSAASSSSGPNCSSRNQCVCTNCSEALRGVARMARKAVPDTAESTPAGPGVANSVSGCVAMVR